MDTDLLLTTVEGVRSPDDARDGGLLGLSDHLLVHIGLFCGLSSSDGSKGFNCEECFAKLTPVCKRCHSVLNSSTVSVLNATG